jgi:MoxR-like ATPase
LLSRLLGIKERGMMAQNNAEVSKDNAPKSGKKVSNGEVQSAASTLSAVRTEIGKVFFGQEQVVNSLVRALLCDGHVLLEGVPGIAKTLVIKTLAQVSGCSSKRIQFTVDLLPSDIVGLTTYTPNKGFEVAKGPIFANFIIADEINRSPPKTQSALIEAMQEKQVTIGKETFKLPNPFFVMANQNPLENEGVYSLPEAQVDRFLFKIVFSYPSYAEEARIMETNTTFKKFEDYDIKSIVSPSKILALQKLTHKIYVDEKVKKYIVDIVTKTRTRDFELGKYLELGASPRASIGLFIAAKAEALMQGRNYVIPKDVKIVAYDVLRHRLILSFRSRAEGVDADKVISEILRVVPLA